MKPLVWDSIVTDGTPRERTMIGAFEATITRGGAGTVGVNVFVATFAGRVVAIQVSFAEAERALRHAAVRMLVEAATTLKLAKDAPGGAT